MWSLSILIFFISIWCTAGVLISAFMEYWYLLPFIQFVLVLSMTTITFLVCLMYLWCSHHSWSVSYLLCFTTAYLLSYTFNNLLTRSFKAYSDHTFRYITSLSYVTSCSSICTSWIAISSSCPPLACTNALLWPFQCAVWPFVALLQYEAWSGICVATIYDSSPCRDCRPAAPPPTRLPRTL